MKFRCRRCQEETTDPLDHAQGHGLPQTMAQVWESFTLLGGKRDSEKREPARVVTGQRSLW